MVLMRNEKNYLSIIIKYSSYLELCIEAPEIVTVIVLNMEQLGFTMQ